jgi:hypothetical protein
VIITEENGHRAAINFDMRYLTDVYAKLIIILPKTKERWIHLTFLSAARCGSPN